MMRKLGFGKIALTLALSSVVAGMALTAGTHAVKGQARIRKTNNRASPATPKQGKKTGRKTQKDPKTNVTATLIRPEVEELHKYVDILEDRLKQGGAIAQKANALKQKMTPERMRGRTLDEIEENIRAEFIDVMTDYHLWIENCAKVFAEIDTFVSNEYHKENDYKLRFSSFAVRKSGSEPSVMLRDITVIIGQCAKVMQYAQRDLRELAK